MPETIFFFDHFYDSSAELLIRQLKSVASYSKDVRLIINSPGGSVMSLMSIIDAIELLNINLETVCMGQAASCGSVLFALGKKRRITKNSRILLHQVSGGTYGNIQDMEIGLEEAKRLNEKYLDILSKAVGKDKETLRADTQRDLVLTAEQAVQYGIADSILDDSLIQPEVELFKKSQFEKALKDSFSQLSEEKEIKFYTLKDKELFKAGTYRGKAYTEQDIEDLVNNTNSLIEKFQFKIPLKAGHDNSKEMLSLLSEGFKKLIKSDSMPALGFVENIRKVDSAAVGDFVNIPEPIYNLIDKQLFCKRSPEIWRNYKVNNQEFGMVLDSIALLGATQPEIPDLFTKEYNVDNTGDDEMSEELKKLLAAKEAELEAEKEKQTQALAAAEAKAKEAQDKLEAFEKAQKEAEIEAKANELLTSGAILPFQKEAVKAVLSNIQGCTEEVKFNKKDGETETDLVEAFTSVLKERPTVDLLKEYGHGGEEKDSFTRADVKAAVAHGGVSAEDAKIAEDFLKNN